MLQEVCEHIHNYFIKDALRDTHKIVGGTISLPFKEGQRFLILGSDLNDGIYDQFTTSLKRTRLIC